MSRYVQCVSVWLWRDLHGAPAMSSAGMVCTRTEAMPHKGQIIQDGRADSPVQGRQCLPALYLILGADKLCQFNLEYEAYCWRKYKEVPKYQRKRALVLTTRKLVRLVFALLT